LYAIACIVVNFVLIVLMLTVCLRTKSWWFSHDQSCHI